MKKFLTALSVIALAACSGPAFDPASVADATEQQVTRVEPLSWWTGMKMPLQLLVQGENISEYDQGALSSTFTVTLFSGSVRVNTRTLSSAETTSNTPPLSPAASAGFA